MTWRSAAVAAVAVLGTAGAVTVAGTADPHLDVRQARPHQLPLTAATLSCPRPLGPAGTTAKLFAVGPNTSGDSRADSRVAVTALGAGSQELAATSGLGMPVRVGVPAASGSPDAGPQGVLVTAAGPIAAGLTAAEVSTFASRSLSGRAATWCSAPRAQWWFTGLDTSVGSTTTLLLSNPGPGLTVLDLQFFGPRGPVDAPGASGVALGPRSEQLLDLARFAPDLAALTLHLTASRGTVAAAISTTRLDAVTPTGSEWLSASTGPAARTVVDAGVGGARSQRLEITNPGSRQQLVSVQILDRTGAFTSTELSSVQVPPGSVVVRDITAITKHRATAIELRSAAPVTGAVVSEVAGRVRDFAVSGVSEALRAPAVIPTIKRSALTLSFSSSSPAPQTVQIRTMDSSGGALRSQTVTARGRATTSWSLPAGTSTSYVVVRLVAGRDLQAVASYSGPDGVTQLPVLPGRWTVIRPAVVPRYP